MINARRLLIAAAMLTLVGAGARASETESLLKVSQEVSAETASGTFSGTSSKVARKQMTTGEAHSRHLSALEKAITGDNKKAILELKALSRQALPEDELDRVYLSLARTQYQAGKYKDAIESYNKIRKASPAWLEALEERASAYMKLNQPQEALASLKTVLTPLFQDRILTEPYFLAALAQLRICDFKSVFKTIDLFKERFRERIQAWEAEPGNPVAQARLHETRATIQKINLVEAEVIQRLYMDESGKRMAGSPPPITRGEDQLTFPIDPDVEAKEVWVDEVDSYRVSIKGCPTSPAAKAKTSQIAKKERSL